MPRESRTAKLPLESKIESFACPNVARRVIRILHDAQVGRSGTMVTGWAFIHAAVTQKSSGGSTDFMANNLHIPPPASGRVVARDTPASTRVAFSASGLPLPHGVKCLRNRRLNSAVNEGGRSRDIRASAQLAEWAL